MTSHLGMETNSSRTGLLCCNTYIEILPYGFIGSVTTE